MYAIMTSVSSSFWSQTHETFSGLAACADLDAMKESLVFTNAR